jgi:hypothetical protein
MTRRAPVSWLYTRGEESVFVYEVARFQLAICGPGPERQVRTFRTADELFRFNQRHANMLAGSGFRCEGFGLERRSGSDRRRVLRTHVDRRRPTDTSAGA